MVFTNPLDLETWLVGTFAGSIPIFVALAFIVIAGLAAYFRMPNSIMIISLALFTLVLGTYTGDVFVLLAIFVALAAGTAIAWLIKR